MGANNKRVAPGRRLAPLSGSFRSRPEDAKIVGSIDEAETFVVRLYLKNPAVRAHAPGSAADLAALARPTTRRALARRRAAEYAPVVAVIKKFAKKNGLAFQRFQANRRCVILKGSASKMTKAFGASLHMYERGTQKFRARSGSLKLPPPIARWTRAVLGFDHRPQVKLRGQAEEGMDAGLWPSDIAKLYGIPIEGAVPQQCVGIVALGGGYLLEDVNAAMAQANRPLPTIVESSADGTKNQFGGGTSADEEIALDMQVLAGIVPGAKIVVYFARNATDSLAAAIHQAVFDDVNRPSVISLSWGSAEKVWKEGPRSAMQAALADAVNLKISVTVASGDYLATGGLNDGAAHVFFPSSSPYVLACGGTKLTLQGDAIASEVVWKDNITGTGGGISEIFPVPVYQNAVPLPVSVTTVAKGRGVPDVAAAAADAPGYRIIVGGNPIVKNGTSAVAPLWAAMISLANARRNARLGLVNSHLYANLALFRPIIEGDNRVGNIGYAAAPGLAWNACTGLGVPARGADIIAALAAV